MTAIAAYPFLAQRGRDVVFLCFAWGAMIPVIIVERRSLPEARFPWRVLLVALGLGGIASTVRRVPGWEEVAAQTVPVLDAVGNGLMLVAALAVVARRGRGDIGGLIDTTIVSLALGGLLWSVLLLPHMEAGNRAFGAKATLFVTVMALCGALGALVRLIETDTERLRPLRFLLGALALHLSSCVLLTVWNTPTASVIGRMLFMTAYLSLGVFALDRSTAKLMQPGAPPRDALGPRRLVFLGAAMAAVPLVAGVRVLWGNPVDALFLALGSAAMAPLVMVRIGLLSAETDRSGQMLRHLAAHDPLTGVLNRREFTERLCARLRSGEQCVLVFCDLDGFKKVNDELGHQAGDRLLIEVANRLSACVSDKDSVGRFGGDEFLVLFSDAGEAELGPLCERIRQAIGKPFQENIEGLTISVGAVASNTGEAEELIRRADNAMYAAKQPRLAIEPIAAGIA